MSPSLATNTTTHDLLSQWCKFRVLFRRLSGNEVRSIAGEKLLRCGASPLICRLFFDFGAPTIDSSHCFVPRYSNGRRTSLSLSYHSFPLSRALPPTSRKAGRCLKADAVPSVFFTFLAPASLRAPVSNGMRVNYKVEIGTALKEGVQLTVGQMMQPLSIESWRNSERLQRR